MCCRHGPRRQPLALALGALAYKKYQERKQQQQSLPAWPTDHRLERRSSPPAHILEREANGEILEKAGIAPPSYDAVVNNHDSRTVRSEKQISSSHDNVSSDEDDDLSDAESFFELDREGKRQGSAEMSAAQADFVRNWKASRGLDLDVDVEDRPVVSKWQQRRAKWAVRRAEKAAGREDRAVMAL